MDLGGLTFYNLTIAKSAQADTVNSTAGMTVTNLFTMTTGTWNASSFTHSIAGAWNSSGATFTFTATTSTITLSSANPNITTKVPPTDPFYNLTLNNGGVLQSRVQVGLDLTIAGTLNTNTRNLTVLRHVLGAGTLAAAGTETITVGGSFTPSGFTASSSTVTLNGATTPVNVEGLHLLRPDDRQDATGRHGQLHRGDDGDQPVHHDHRHLERLQLHALHRRGLELLGSRLHLHGDHLHHHPEPRSTPTSPPRASPTHRSTT